jgi:choline-sulfatase
VEGPANLLLVTFDQWRGDWGDPGRPVVPLPALTALAGQGVVASRCYTASPHCVPARFSWLTGLAPSQLGITRNEATALPADAPSLVRPLQQQGWHTELVGKSHWSSHAEAGDLADNLPLLQALGFARAEEVAGPRALRRMRCGLTRTWEQQGWLEAQRADLERRYGPGLGPEAWAVRPSPLPAALYPDVWIAERALERLAALPETQPWLLWVSFVGPHEPFDTPAPWAGRHSAEALPPAEPAPAWADQLPEDSDLARLRRRWQGRLSPAAIQACRADYADHLRLLDDQLGRLLEALANRGDADRTAVLATADHGELLGDWDALYKGALLESAVRVPWVYRPPGGCRPQRWRRPLPLTELLAQCWAGLPQGGGVDRLRRWVRGCSAAVVEFGEELLVLQGQRKLVLDGQGQPLWASRVRSFGADRAEVIRQQPWRWRLSPGWRRLRRRAGQEWQRRRSAGWLWRDLRP